MAFGKTPAAAGDGARAFDARARKAFLDHLAMTSNVAASSRVAGISAARAYAFRRRNPGFYDLWQKALAEGFARLEAELLAEALRAVSGKVSDATLKSRAQRQRLGLSLLAMHRAAVRGVPKPMVAASDTRAALTAKVEAKLLDLRARLKAQDAEADDAARD